MSADQKLFTTNRLKKAQGTDVDHQQVEQVAYRLYEERGREDGHAVEDWLRAEAIVRKRQSV